MYLLLRTNVMLDFFVWAPLSCEERKTSGEIQNEIYVSPPGIEPATTHFQTWRSDRLFKGDIDDILR